MADDNKTPEMKTSETRIIELEKQAVALKAYLVAGGVCLAILGWSANQLSEKVTHVREKTDEASKAMIDTSAKLALALSAAESQLDKKAAEAVARAATVALTPKSVTVTHTPVGRQLNILVETGSSEKAVVSISGLNALPAISYFQARGDIKKGLKGIYMEITFSGDYEPDASKAPAVSFDFLQPGAKEPPYFAFPVEKNSK